MGEIWKSREHFLEKLRINLRFLIILCVSFIEVFLNIGRMVPGDSYQYLNFALFFLGRGGYVSPYVVMRPIVPFLASVLTLAFQNIYLSFGLVSGFFWVSGTVVAYKLGQLILKDEDLASAVGLAYTTAPVLLVTGAAVLTDSASFFFIGLAIYLTLKRERTSEVSSKTYFLDAFVCSVGIMFKESVVFALLFMLSVRLLKKKGFRETLLAIFLVGIVWLAYLQLLGFGVDVFFRKYSRAQEMATSESWGLLTYAGSFVTAFITNLSLPRPLFVSAGFWIWAAASLIYGSCTLLGCLFDPRRKVLWAILLFLFPSSVIWPEMSFRFSFLLWPVVIPSMTSGMSIALSRLRPVEKRIPFNPRILMFLYIILLAVINTLNTLSERGSLTIPLR